jgi:hypothetical protein
MPIELTLRLAREHEITPERIAALRLVLPRSREIREAIYGAYPKGPSTLVAIALTDRRFDPGRFEEELGAELLAVREKVQVRFEDGRDFFYARLEIDTTDGQHVTAEGDGRLDGPPLGRSTWREVAGDDLDEASLTRLEDLVRNLEHVAHVRELTECLAQARPRSEAAGVTGLR